MKEYFKTQGRFRHLNEDEIAQIQKIVDREWELLLKKEEMTNKK